MRIKLVWLNLLVAIAVSATPASAQIFGAPTGSRTYTPPKFEADASQAPPQLAMGCYLSLLMLDVPNQNGLTLRTFAVANPDDYVPALIAAYRKRIEEALRAAGQAADADMALQMQIRELRAQVAQSNPAFGLEWTKQQTRTCLVAGSAHLVKLRSDPAVGPAFSCWAVGSASGDIDAALLAPDVNLAIWDFRMPVFIDDLAREQAKLEAQTGLASPQAAQIKAQFAGCADKTRVALHNKVWASRGPIIGADNYFWKIMLQNLRQQGADRGDRDLQYMAANGGTMIDPVEYAKWNANPALASATLCAAMEPYRSGMQTANQITYMDIAIRSFKGAGIPPIATYQITASVGEVWNLFTTFSQLEESCKAWGEGEAKKLGGTLYHAPEPK